MKRATLLILAVLVFGFTVKADTMDDFSFTEGGLYPATFALPSTVTPTGSILFDSHGNFDGSLAISDIPVAIDGTTIDFTMQFFGTSHGDSVEMGCATPGFPFCTFLWDVGSVNVDQFYTLSNGQITFIPGVYWGMTITEPAVATPEPGTLLLLAMGLAMLVGLRRRSQTC
jgi:hypothetical protein